ncbi:MAG TPA: IS21 family transposase [Armatimonadota bacterium]
MERLSVHQIKDILYRLRKGQSERAIACDLRLSRDAVHRYRQLARDNGYLNPAVSLPEEAELQERLGAPKPPPRQVSSLEGHRELVTQWLEAGKERVAIHQRLVDDHGYTGSYTSVRRFVNTICPREKDATVRIETTPGQEAQVDFGSVGLIRDPKTGKLRTAYAFVMTLSWSRHMYVEFVFDQTIATWIACHRNAFLFFGGCPKEVVVDNLKAAVIQHAIEDPVLCEPYRKMARHYGFLIHPCRPRTPQHKGKVENGVHYVKRNLVASSDFHDIRDANEKAIDWCMHRAGLRRHGTTQEQPLKRFRETEQTLLLPLPEEAFDLRSVHPAKVHRDCHVVFEGSYYSAPYAYVGGSVDLHAYERVVQLYDGVNLLVTHQRAAQKGTRVTRVEHYPKEKALYLARTPTVCRELAKEIGPCCFEVMDHLFSSERQTDNLRAAQSLLRLTERYGHERVEAACRRALFYQRPLYVHVRSILNAGLENDPLPGETPPNPPQRTYRHERAADEFFRVGTTPEHNREVASC